MSEMSKSWGEILRADAERLDIPPRTLEQVQSCIAMCKRQKSDTSMARLMLTQGRLAEDAREWLAREYPQ